MKFSYVTKFPLISSYPMSAVHVSTVLSQLSISWQLLSPRLSPLLSLPLSSLLFLYHCQQLTMYLQNNSVASSLASGERVKLSQHTHRATLLRVTKVSHTTLRHHHLASGERVKSAYTRATLLREAKVSYTTLRHGCM